jgi:hypothetical protein
MSVVRLLHTYTCKSGLTGGNVDEPGRDARLVQSWESLQRFGASDDLTVRTGREDCFEHLIGSLIVSDMSRWCSGRGPDRSGVGT